MSEKQFSHVCTSCHAPTIVNNTNGSILQTILLLAVIAVLTTIGGIIGFVIGIIGAFFIAFHLNRQRAKSCPSCHTVALIPVGSPQGMKIMKEHGWIES